jgi:hypothetical protein
MARKSKNSSKKEKASNDTKRSQTGYLTHTGERGKCAFCDKSGSAESPLLICSRCGMCAYCDVSCQKQAYPEHKAWCKQTAENITADDNKGLKRILFSRAFGGAVSLLLKRGKMKYGRGMVHGVCSHSLPEFCEKRRVGDNKRTITLTYVPDGEPVKELQNRSLGDVQAQCDEDGVGSLQSSMLIADQLTETMRDSGAIDMGQDPMCIVGIESPVAKYLHMCVFVSYLNPSHGAHEFFDLLCSHHLLDENTFTLEWDWDVRTSVVTAEDALQHTFHTAVRAGFYRECSIAWQEKKKTQDPSPWPGGVVTPPLALGLDMVQIPN